jgi:hypothetical protein
VTSTHNGDEQVVEDVGLHATALKAATKRIKIAPQIFSVQTVACALDAGFRVGDDQKLQKF